MIKHIVLFRFKASENKEVILNEIKARLENLVHLIPELKEIQAGININPAEKWDLSLEVVVKDRHDLETYTNHPDHQEIVSTLIAPRKEDRACVDFIL